MSQQEFDDGVDHDRVVDAMLEEATGRAQPPDLTARIAAELGQSPLQAVDTLQVGDAAQPLVLHPRRRGASWRPMLAAAAAGVLIGFGVSAWLGAPMEVPVEFEVVHGEIELNTAGAGQTLTQATPSEQSLAIGDRIHSAGGAAVRLQPFGLLELNQESTVEVESMSWTKRDGVLVVGSLAFGSVAGAFAWSQFGGDGTPVEAGTLREQRDANVATNTAGESYELVGLRDEIARLEAENATLTAAAEREVVEMPEEPDAATAELKIELLEAGGAQDKLANIDFALIGKTSAELAPLITQLAEALKNGEQPLELIGQISALNGGLISEAGKIVEAGIEGSGVNGAYTHPSVAGNRIMATLEAAGLGLDADQRSRLQNLMNEHGDLERNMRIADVDRELSLETLVEEVENKSRFFDEVRGMLGADQSSLILDDSIGERVQLNLHGPGLVLAQYSQGTAVSDRGALVDKFTSRLGQHFGLDREGSAQMRQVVDDWSNELPPDFFDNKADELENMGMMRTARIRDAARRQLALMQRVLAQFGSNMTPAQREAFVSQQRIIVPLPQ